MNIVVVNDDGWGTAGIRLLAKEMTKLGRVFVIAPDGPRSGSGACISVTTPITIKRIEEHDLEVVLKEQPIDLVVSGINHGSNASINVIYSGTMGACLVAAEKGIPAIGWSIIDHALDADLHWIQPFLCEITQHLLEEGITPRTCYNINAPVGEIEGIRWTRQCKGHWQNELIPDTESPMREGLLSQWRLAGEFVNDEPDAQDTDIWALDHQLLAITPITVDLTAYGSL